MRFIYSSAALLLIMTCQATAKQNDPVFNETLFRQDIKTLSSDEFEGRAPTTHGEKLTLTYLISAFKKMGLKPTTDGGYLQKVPMVSYTASDDQQVSLAGLDLKYRQDVVLTSRHSIESIAIKQAPLVFVGYGINAPEYNWNDYKGLDMHGKIAVILVNDPGFSRPDLNKFNGTAMTYYGRWTYKFEEASRQGALGAIIIHDTKPAAYPWGVVEQGWTGPQQDLVSDKKNERVQVEGWITLESAQALFTKAGLKLNQLMAKAATMPTNQILSQQADISFINKIHYADSYNVVATLPGSTHADEHILFTGHWDHLGINPTFEGDQIYNGAMDNAAGIASILALARNFSAAAKNGDPLQRSLTFIATTGEEQGLLGSSYYAANPLYPLEKTIGVINLDSTNIYGPTKDLTIIGKGKSELELYLTAALKEQQRYAKAEKNPASGGFFRSDHFSFAKYGVPAVFAGGGDEPIDEATATYKKMMKAQMKGCYHNVCDEYSDNWNVAGALADLVIFYNAAKKLANSDDYPGYYKDTEFYSLRPETGVSPQ